MAPETLLKHESFVVEEKRRVIRNLRDADRPDETHSFVWGSVYGNAGRKRSRAHLVLLLYVLHRPLPAPKMLRISESTRHRSKVGWSGQRSSEEGAGAGVIARDDDGGKVMRIGMVRKKNGAAGSHKQGRWRGLCCCRSTTGGRAMKFSFQPAGNLQVVHVHRGGRR